MSMNEALDLTDLSKLNYSIETRETLAKAIITNAVDGFPTDKNDRDFLIQLLNGMDSAIIKKAKLKIDNSAVENQKQVNSIISSVLTRIGGDGRNTGQNRIIPTIDKSIVVDNPVNGELKIGLEFFSYDDIVN